MPRYVLMTKLGQQDMHDLKNRREIGERWKRKVEAVCPGIKWIAHYALLGPYDFMDVYEVPEPSMAFRVSALSRQEGAVSAESWPAIAYDSFVADAEEIGRET